MDLKTVLVKTTCLLLLNRQTLCLLKRTDPNVCEILVSGENDNSEAYTIECCLAYFEEDDICKPCRPGNFGRQCSETCVNGYYGSQCKGVCSCTKYERCDPVTGCECIDFTGTNCKYRCPAGFYGKNCVNICQCIRGVDCDAVTGSCICPAGFTGPSCTTKCSEGLYGENCSFNCSCSTSAVCDSISGNCSCSPGFIGEICTERCPDNFYGQNCSQRCHCANDLSCHPVHGACQCQNGTNECENVVTKPTYSSRSSILLLTGVSCSGGSFIVIAAFVLAVCYFKRKNLQESASVQPSRPLPEINHYDEINPYDEMSLENMPVASDIVSPYYSYAREQFRRLSLPSTNVRLNNQTRNGETRGYISLPNLSNDGTYLSPYNWKTESNMINVNSNPNGKPLQRGDSETSDYLHPYNALSRPIDLHEYTKIEHVENQTVHKNDILTIHNQMQITIELEKFKGE